MFLDPLFPTWFEKASRLVTSLHIADARVSEAMRRVPRHRFVSRGLWTTAYVDTPLPVGPNATISAPHMVAMQLVSADIREGMKVMELGSGSGYLAAIAARLCGSTGFVTAVEIEPSLVERSQKVFRELGFHLVGPGELPRTHESERGATGFDASSRSPEVSAVSMAAASTGSGRLSGNLHVHRGDGRLGDSEFGPYDRIVVSYAQPLPGDEAWIGQLKEEGVIVMPIERDGATYLDRWERGLSGWEMRAGPQCLFVSRK